MSPSVEYSIFGTWQVQGQGTTVEGSAPYSVSGVLRFTSLSEPNVAIWCDIVETFGFNPPEIISQVVSGTDRFVQTNNYIPLSEVETPDVIWGEIFLLDENHAEFRVMNDSLIGNTYPVNATLDLTRIAEEDSGDGGGGGGCNISALPGIALLLLVPMMFLSAKMK